MNPSLLTLLAATLLAAGPALKEADSAPPAQNKVTITVRGDKRIIESNGIPDHKVASFPNRGNPNSISEQKYRLEVPARPQPATEQPGRFPYAWGVALNGVVFDPGTAEVYNDGDRSNPWRYEALKSNTEMGTTPRIPTGLGLDQNHGHVQPNGAYHYHGLPTLLIARLSGGEQKMTHVGLPFRFDALPLAPRSLASTNSASRASVSSRSSCQRIGSSLDSIQRVSASTSFRSICTAF